MSRQQARQLARERIALGRRLAASGLGPVPKKSELVALAALLRHVLGDARQPSPAAAAAELMHQTFERSLAAHPPRMKLACAKGCAFCCNSWVGATAPEVFLVVRGLRARGREGEDLLAALATTAGRSIEDRTRDVRPCALLAAGLCTVYEERPTTCRMTTSISAAACAAEFGGGAEATGIGDLEIVVSKLHLDHARSARLPLVAALRSLDLPTDAYELSASVSRVLTTPRAEQRWLAGEAIFEGIERAPPEAKAFIDATALIARELAPG